ncbi:MAG: hypothetical protein MZU84_06320 [Sphingobacterium sp.]|nr:hypothetical protein [Sphingobacterium sp.]
MLERLPARPTRSCSPSRPRRSARTRRGGAGDRAAWPERAEWLSPLPVASSGWWLFFLVPTAAGLRPSPSSPSDPFGGIGPGWTLGDAPRPRPIPNYLAIAWRTLWVSLADDGALPAAGRARPATPWPAPPRAGGNTLLLLVDRPVLDELPHPRLRLEVAPPSRGADQASASSCSGLVDADASAALQPGRRASW